MDDESEPAAEEFKFQTVGEQLRAERESQSLTLADVAARTRIPMRHLEAIEKSEFSALPGATYTLGFTRSYARALGLDDGKLSQLQREELAQGGHESYQAPTQSYEPADPARVPSSALAWAAAAIAILLVAGYLIWRSNYLGDTTDPYADAPATKAVAKAAPEAAPDPAGAVVLTATEPVWVKIYDEQENRLFEKEMAAGESYTVPADAKNPMIVTGRPQSLTVTVGGKLVAPLGAPDRTIADVGVSAAALLARPAATEPATGGGTSTPAASTPRRTTAQPTAKQPAATTAAPATTAPPATDTAPDTTTPQP